MNNAQINQIGTLFADATMKAAAATINGQKLTDAQIDALVVSMRREAKAALHRFLNDGNKLIACGRQGWLGAAASTACAEAGRRAVKEVLSGKELKNG